MAAFDYSLDFAAIDFREHPKLYRVGRGEQGVLLVEPYKSELLTRARRYANHPSGRKYDHATGEVLPRAADWDANEKAKAARIYYEHYAKAQADPDYQRAKRQHQQAFG
jgi:hypothetical protein